MDDTARNASARRETVCRLELFVDTYAPYRPCVFAVRRVHIDPRERHRRRPPRLTRFRRTRMSNYGRTRVVRSSPRARQSRGRLPTWKVIVEVDTEPRGLT
jgi:hypothetical protein